MMIEEMVMDDWSDTAATFGDRLAAARDAQGLSQSQLARKLGLRLQTIRNWEEDRSEPRANKLQMLAGFLNVSMVWMMTGEGEGGPGARSADADGEGSFGSSIRDLVAELRELRLGQVRSAERMALLEKRLRAMEASG